MFEIPPITYTSMHADVIFDGRTEMTGGCKGAACLVLYNALAIPWLSGHLVLN